MEIYKAKAWKEKLTDPRFDSKDLRDFINYYKSFVDEVEEFVKASVRWSFDDFEHQAKSIEENHNNGDPMFDRDKFKDALYRMIDKHDAELGITWVTIEFYLEEYCKIEEDE